MTSAFIKEFISFNVIDKDFLEKKNLDPIEFNKPQSLNDDDEKINIAEIDIAEINKDVMNDILDSKNYDNDDNDDVSEKEIILVPK